MVCILYLNNFKNLGRSYRIYCFVHHPLLTCVPRAIVPPNPWLSFSADKGVNKRVTATKFLLFILLINPIFPVEIWCAYVFFLLLLWMRFFFISSVSFSLLIIPKFSQISSSVTFNLVYFMVFLFVFSNLWISSR